MATTRTSGIGKGAMPVWPVAIRRERDMVALTAPEYAKIAARIPEKTQVTVFMPIADDRRSDPVTLSLGDVLDRL